MVTVLSRRELQLTVSLPFPFSLLHPLADLLQRLSRPLKVLLRQVDLRGQSRPQLAAMHQDCQEGVVLLDQDVADPLSDAHGTRHVSVDMAVEVNGQCDIGEVDVLPQRALGILHDLGAEGGGYNFARFSCELPGVGHDRVFARLALPRDPLSPRQGGRNAEIGRAVDGAHKFEVVDEFRLGGRGEGGGDRYMYLTLRIARPRRESVTCRKSAPHEMLVADGTVQDGAAAGHVKPLVRIRDVEVGVQVREMHGDVAEAVGAIDDGENALLAANGRQCLEGHPHTRH